MLQPNLGENLFYRFDNPILFESSRWVAAEAGQVFEGLFSEIAYMTPLLETLLKNEMAGLYQRDRFGPRQDQLEDTGAIIPPKDIDQDRDDS